jgi:N-acetylmuramoyl-L-alanine amidase
MKLRRTRRAVFSILAIAALVSVLAPAPAAAQSTAVRYQRLAAREKTVRAAKPPALASLRTLAKSYEDFTRAHYLSGYADNALWQAAELYETVYARSRDPRDRDQSIRLLKWLRKEYPTGTLAKQADQRLRALERTDVPKATASTPPPAPAVGSAAPATPSPESAGAGETPTAASTVPTPATSAAPPPAASVAEVPVAPAASSPSPSAPQGRAGAGREAAASSTRARGAVPAKPEGAPAAGAPVTSAPLAPLSAPPSAQRPPAVPKPEDMPVTASTPVVRDISYSTLPKGDRIIFEFSLECMYSATRLTSPDRVVIDFCGAGIAPALVERAAKVGGTLIKSVAVTRAPNGGLKVTIDLSAGPRYSTFPLYDPFRLVIDVESDTAAAGRGSLSPGAARTAAHDTVVLASAPAPAADAIVRNVAPSTTKGGDYSLARQLGLGVSRIVIDPGHGGHDPGASANGITEAELVLDVALRLETLLAAHEGTDVVLTRRKDEYVALEERTAIANHESADMFVSIHANASPQKTASGVETFFLDFASNPHAQSVAARENAMSDQNMRVLPELVKTIALNNKLQESRELADVVQASLVKRLRVKDAGARDLGVKRAPFVVLIGAQMPSVLAEVSFLTNKAEANLLKQSAYRQRIAQALADAIVKYQGMLKKVAGATTARNER